MMDQLKRLEPFPDSRLFQDLNRQLQVWRQSLSLRDHLYDFLCSETLKRHLASSAASSLALQHLDSMLTTHGSALESMIVAAASDEDTARLLQRTVSKLFQLNSFSQDDKTLQLAASCLGRIGPINVHSVMIGVEVWSISYAAACSMSHAVTCCRMPLHAVACRRMPSPVAGDRPDVAAPNRALDPDPHARGASVPSLAISL